MKILHVIPSLAARYGGPSQAAIEMVRDQNAAGIHADIATTYKADESPVQEDLRGGKIFLFKSYCGEYKYSPGLKRWLKEHTEDYDLLHIHSVFCYSTKCAARFAAQWDKPYILRPLGQIYPWALNSRSSYLKKTYLWLYENKNIKKAAAIHFTTEHEKKSWGLSFEPRSSYVLSLGVEAVPILPAEKARALYPEYSQKKILLFISRVHPKKGLHLLIPWLADILKDSREWILVIAGGGKEAYLEKLKGLISEHDLADKVFFTGRVEGESKSALLQLGKIFVLPSQSENFGIVVAEAMRAGLAVLISDGVGLCEDVVRAGAGRVFTLTQESFLAAVKSFMEDEVLRERMSRDARKFAQEHYDWHKITKKQTAIYQALICRQPLEMPR